LRRVCAAARTAAIEYAGGVSDVVRVDAVSPLLLGFAAAAATLSAPARVMRDARAAQARSCRVIRI